MEEEKESVQMNMSLYDLNKNIIFNLPPQDENILNKNFRNINSWFCKYDNPWFMLMCKERSDFTLIHITKNNYFKAVQELKEILQERGAISSLQYNQDQDVWEIWVKDEKEAYVFMLFEASWMIVEI